MLALSSRPSAHLHSGAGHRFCSLYGAIFWHAKLELFSPTRGLIRVTTRSIHLVQLTQTFVAWRTTMNYPCGLKRLIFPRRSSTERSQVHDSGMVVKNEHGHDILITKLVALMHKAGG